MMPAGSICALILAEPGPIREGLRQLISTLPEVRWIGTVANEDEVIKFVQKERPMLVILHSRFRPKGGRAVIQQIKSIDPRIVCIAIVSDVEQKKLASEAGADSVQMTGYPAEELYRTIQFFIRLHGEVAGGRLDRLECAGRPPEE